MNPPRTAAAGSTTDKEMITMAEEELARLHRQLRIMEDDRIAFSEETSSKLEKQRKIIHTLKNEKQKIVEDINVATCANQKKKDEQLTNEICRLLENYDKYDKLVRDEREQIQELEIQIQKSLITTTDSIICSKCSDKLQRAFEFKTTCLNNNDYLKTFVHANSSIALVLEEVIVKELLIKDEVKPEEEKVCRFCLKYFGTELFTKLNELEEDIFLSDMVEKCLPEMMEDDIRSLRPKTAVTEQDYQYRLTSGQKSIKTLQNRLDNSIKKFCCILTENKKLREDIDHLLKEMNHFNLVWEKLLKDMNSGKKYMVDLIEQATLAYDQREEWCSKLEALKKRAQNDFIAHSEEMREVQRQLDHDLTLREFLSVKGQRRILRDLEEKERKKKELQKQNLENQLRLYEQTLEQIQAFCEENDVERIASQFLKQEEENFALFNYVNELNHEIETLHANLNELEEKIDEQVQLSQARAKERQATLRSLQYDLDEAIGKAETEEEGVKQAEKVLQDVLNGIEGIFKLLDCDRGPILELLGESSSINFFNVNIYLGTIEKRISTIITMVYFAEKAMLTQARKFSKEDLVKLMH